MKKNIFFVAVCMIISSSYTVGASMSLRQKESIEQGLQGWFTIAKNKNISNVADIRAVGTLVQFKRTPAVMVPPAKQSPQYERKS